MQIFEFTRTNGMLEIKTPYNSAFVKLVKTISGREWDPAKKIWRVPDSAENFEILITEIKKLGGVCNVINAATPSVKKSDINKNFYPPQAIPIFDDNAVKDNDRKSKAEEKDGARRSNWLEKFGREMRLLKYSQKTIKTYCGYINELINHSMKSPELITSEDITAFMEHLVDNRAFSASTLNIAINAFKFFFKSINHDNLDYNIKRPRKDKKLPVILAVNEVAAIFDSTTNFKHRLLLMAAYSAGLRVSEVVSLKLSDIDLERNLITIRAGKGRKDRIALLSNTFRKSLAEYEKIEKPGEWLFPGHSAGTHIAVRTAEKVFENALKKSGIKKRASIHTLRHSFATHLLESGIDIRYIQKLLGHANVKTTEIYTHVSAKHLISIKSPLDKIFKE
jgi:site-specific recombinase XerD